MRIRKILPKQSVQFLFREVTEELTERLLKDRIDIDIKYTGLTKGLVELFHGAGLKVNCWTVDDVKTANELIEMGVDYITSNILE